MLLLVAIFQKAFLGVIVEACFQDDLQAETQQGRYTSMEGEPADERFAFQAKETKLDSMYGKCRVGRVPNYKW